MPLLPPDNIYIYAPRCVHSVDHGLCGEMERVYGKEECRAQRKRGSVIPARRREKKGEREEELSGEVEATSEN